MNIVKIADTVLQWHGTPALVFVIFFLAALWMVRQKLIFWATKLTGAASFRNKSSSAPSLVPKSETSRKKAPQPSVGRRTRKTKDQAVFNQVGEIRDLNREPFTP